MIECGRHLVPMVENQVGRLVCPRCLGARVDEKLAANRLPDREGKRVLMGDFSQELQARAAKLEMTEDQYKNYLTN